MVFELLKRHHTKQFSLAAGCYSLGSYFPCSFVLFITDCTQSLGSVTGSVVRRMILFRFDASKIKTAVYANAVCESIFCWGARVILRDTLREFVLACFGKRLAHQQFRSTWLCKSQLVFEQFYETEWWLMSPNDFWQQKNWHNNQNRKFRYKREWQWKMLSTTFDKKLSFKKHIEDLCKKANQKFHALARISNFMDPTKVEILMNSFIKSQFNHCPLVWMFHDRGSNSKTNRIQERALQLICRESGRELDQMKENLTNH